MPLPLRPRRTSVSPSGTSKVMRETIKRLRISFMWKETSLNSICFFEESAVFVFISIDSNKTESDYFNAPSLPTPNFWRILRVEVASKRRGETPWELSLQLSASGMTFTADY